MINFDLIGGFDLRDFTPGKFHYLEWNVIRSKWYLSAFYQSIIWICSCLYYLSWTLMLILIYMLCQICLVAIIVVSFYCRERSERPTLRCNSFSLSYHSYPLYLIPHVHKSRKRWFGRVREGPGGSGAGFLSPISSQTAKNIKKLKIQYESR